MKFDGPTLAHAWLAVYSATCTRKDGPAALFKTIAIEEHPTGVRLLSTDGFVLLTAWVPDLDHDGGPTPTLDESPDRIIIASDDDGRARSLLGYVISLANRVPEEEYVSGGVPLTLTFDVRIPAGQAAVTQETLEGMEPTYVVLSVPDVERVYLETVPAAYPSWRPLVDAHRPVRTNTIRLNPELVERLAKVRKHAAGALNWSFGGAEKAALIEYDNSDPFVHGVVMPMKDPEKDDAQAEVESAAERFIEAAAKVGGITITHRPANGGPVKSVTVGTKS